MNSGLIRLVVTYVPEDLRRQCMAQSSLVTFVERQLATTMTGNLTLGTDKIVLNASSARWRTFASDVQAGGNPVSGTAAGS